MKKNDLAGAIAVAVIWGANFTVTKLGLGGVPPFVLVILRFILAAFPAIFFIKKPETSLKYIILYGMFVGVGQFSLLFYALSIGMPAGISSLILQSQAFITPLIAFFLLKEKITSWQILGLIIASSGLLIIGMNAGNSMSSITPFSFMLTIMAAAMWAVSNIIIKLASEDSEKKGKKLDMLSLVVWSSLVPPIPTYIAGKIIDPGMSIIKVLGHLNFTSVFAIFYLAFLSTIFGYGFWGYLMKKYPVGKVSPMSLLVPVTGLITAGIVLHEKMTLMQWTGCFVIIAGLLISNFGKLIFGRISRTKRALSQYKEN